MKQSNHLRVIQNLNRFKAYSRSQWKAWLKLQWYTESVKIRAEMMKFHYMNLSTLNFTTSLVSQDLWNLSNLLTKNLVTKMAILLWEISLNKQVEETLKLTSQRVMVVQTVLLAMRSDLLIETIFFWCSTSYQVQVLINRLTSMY